MRRRTCQQRLSTNFHSNYLAREESERIFSELYTTFPPMPSDVKVCCCLDYAELHTQLLNICYSDYNVLDLL